MVEKVDSLAKVPLRDRLFLTTFQPLFRLFFWQSSGIWSFFALVILLFVTGYQLAPGREWIDLGWSVGVYYAVVGSAGAIAGFLGGQRRIVATGCGAIAAITSLWMIGFAHEQLPQFLPQRIWVWIWVVALAVGLIPGVLLYGIGDLLLPALPNDQSSHGSGVGRCPNPECRSLRGWDGNVCRYCGTRNSQ